MTILINLFYIYICLRSSSGTDDKNNLLPKISIRYIDRYMHAYIQIQRKIKSISVSATNRNIYIYRDRQTDRQIIGGSKEEEATTSKELIIEKVYFCMHRPTVKSFCNIAGYTLKILFNR